MQTYKARLGIAASERDADQYYAAGVLVPDPFIFFEQDGTRIIVLSDLELERGKREAHVDTVLSFSEYRDRLKEQGNEYPKLVDIAERVLRDFQIRQVLVPGNFALQYADTLRERGFIVQCEEPFWPSRVCKTPQEIEHIQQSQQHNEAALDFAIQILKDSDIGDDRTLYYQGHILTSEELQRQIQLKLLALGCSTPHRTIVSCGEQATRPHESGSGSLKAHQSIIIDIFPQSLTTRYFADLTRTVVKGTASNELKRMYGVVRSGQELALQSIRAGAQGQDIHRQIQELFAAEGFVTEVIDGIPQGFIHGTGHGLGLEIHESPRIGNSDDVLKTGNVVTVEPGLYYSHIGGVRLEDLVVVTETGCQNLTTAPKFLEIP